MGQVELQEETVALLNDPLLGGADIDGKLRQLVAAEYLRRMGHYQRVEQILRRKYGMSFDEFIAQRVVEQHGYRWEVERDAMEWETTIGGIAAMAHRLQELKQDLVNYEQVGMDWL